MLTYLSLWSDWLAGFNVFRYLTFRAGGAVVTAFVLTLIFAPWCIRKLKSLQGEGQPIREDGPARHIEDKKGTPTMGGVFILACLLLTTCLWADVGNGYVWLALGTTLSFGLVGYMDDMAKLRGGGSRGISGRVRLSAEFGIAFIAGGVFLWLAPEGLGSVLAFPGLKGALLPLTWVGFLLWCGVVTAGSANAVNLTDGLDGLAAGPVMVASAAMGLISWVVGNAVFSGYLGTPYIEGVGELAVFCAATVGSVMGFLWFNAPPAKVFMGDTGSLALGGALGVTAVATKHELAYLVIGGLFAMEALSVMVQVGSYKAFGKRVFRMAPFHHHLEQRGWSESTIVIRLWIVSCLLALGGLSTLKLR